MEGKQALTLEAVLDRHSDVFQEELGHILIKLGLPLKPDARPADPRARPEPPAQQDTGGRRCGDGTGGGRSRRDASERWDASGRQKAGRNTGPPTAAGVRSALGCSRPPLAPCLSAGASGR